MVADLLVLLIVLIYVFGLIEQGWPKKILRFLFQKLLKRSDVGNFGIITSKNFLSLIWNNFDKGQWTLVTS